jgi:hypothetical protein
MAFGTKRALGAKQQVESEGVQTSESGRRFVAIRDVIRSEMDRIDESRREHPGHARRDNSTGNGPPSPRNHDEEA